MGITELFFIAVGLSMDAFAVAVCHGLSMRRAGFQKALIIGLYFGIFQAAMPLIGYIVGSRFSDMISDFDHWIVFVLLGFIGAKMIMGSFKKEDASDTEGPCGPNAEASLSAATMLPLALATSIDALAVGVSFAFLQVDIVPAISFIGGVTLIISMAGVKIGNMFGGRFKSKAELAGGIILVLIGLRILLEHLGIIAY